MDHRITFLANLNTCKQLVERANLYTRMYKNLLERLERISDYERIEQEHSRNNSQELYRLRCESYVFRQAYYRRREMIRRIVHDRIRPPNRSTARRLCRFLDSQRFSPFA